jgi:hypothetical protein
MAFNIYKWRRDQLLTESSIHPDPKNLYTGNLNADQNKQRKQMLQQLLDWEKNSPNPDPESIEYLEGQLGNINENEGDSLKVGEHPKSVVSKFDWAYLPGKDKLEATKITKSVIDNLPDELMYTGMQYSKDAQKAIPRFKLAGETKNTGNSMAGYDPKKEEPYIEKRKRDKNI